MPTERRERQRAARQAKKAAEAKKAARKELIRRIVIAVVLGVVVAGLLLLSAALADRSTEVELPPDEQAFRDQPTACGAEAPPPAEQMSFDAPTAQDVPAGTRAVVTTSCGTFTIELASEEYPQTVDSFVFLARQGYYDGTVFHRIAKDFIIQGGDQTASGRGGPGYRVPDEFPEGGFVYSEGVVAMANGGRGTTGSQFFVVVGDQAGGLPPSFNVLGTIVDGADTLAAIESVDTIARPGTVEQSLPQETVYIESVEIVEG
jgi:peptidylprolyl isomerase